MSSLVALGQLGGEGGVPLVEDASVQKAASRIVVSRVSRAGSANPPPGRPCKASLQGGSARKAKPPRLIRCLTRGPGRSTRARRM